MRKLCLLLASSALVACATSQTNPQPRLELARAYLQAGQPEVALQELAVVLREQPHHATAWQLQGLAHRTLGQPQQAEADFRHAVQYNPQDHDAKHNLGWLLCEQARPAEGQAWLQQVAATATITQQERARQALARCIQAAPQAATESK